MPPIKGPFLSGRWYVVATCQNCKRDHILFEDLTDGKARLKATYQWVCPSCEHDGKYEGEDLIRYQHLAEQKGKKIVPKPKRSPKPALRAKAVDRRKRKRERANQ